MEWIFFSLVYTLFNALYLNFNTSRHLNGYLLGIIRGFGIFVITSPLLYFVSSKVGIEYFIILITQGVFIGIYDSHIFFASAKYGTSSTFGFMATSIFITLILWWIIEFQEFEKMLQNKKDFLSLIFILTGVSVSYWLMMKVHINKDAEKFLYPAVFALSFMSIATRYIALNGGNEFDGIIYYLTISCGTSGIYNLILFYKNYKNYNKLKPDFYSMCWLIFFSLILITAKTIAFRIAINPCYVMCILLISPFIAKIIKNKKTEISFENVIFFTFIGLLIFYSLGGFDITFQQNG
ncbi:MAG: hypothetical protein IKW39_05550 [Alphaproteobacteria bacterium]|nr:hypothetical protein [Alphaproteobacteria bacterium]